MKTIKTTLSFFLLLLTVGCAEDKGNYDYTDINEISISGINTQEEYNVVYGDELIIEPTLDFKLSHTDDLSFTWILGSDIVASLDTISEDKNLKAVIETAHGRLRGRYVVTDNKSGMKYFQNFILNVTSPYGKGYFVLSALEDETTVLSFKSLLRPEEPFVTTDNIAGIKYGKKPILFAGVQGKRTGPTDVNWLTYIVSEEGDTPIILTDLKTFIPQAYVNESSFMPGSADYGFSPTFIRLYAYNKPPYIISKGKLVMYRSGLLYRPAALDDPDDYQLAPFIGQSNTLFGGSNNIFTGYDNKNERFRHFSPIKSDAGTGVVGDKYTSDLITDLPEWKDLSTGQKYFGSGEHNSGKNANVNVILKDNSKLYFYNLFNKADNPPLYLHTITQKAEIDQPPGFSESSAYYYSNTSFDWYIGAGNKIYKSNAEIITLSELISLPADAGEITAIRSFSNDGMMLVGTYNKSSSHEMKGNVYIVNIINKTIEESFPNVTGKPKSLFIAE